MKFFFFSSIVFSLSPFVHEITYFSKLIIKKQLSVNKKQLVLCSFLVFKIISRSLFKVIVFFFRAKHSNKWKPIFCARDWNLKIWNVREPRRIKLALRKSMGEFSRSFNVPFSFRGYFFIDFVFKVKII